MVGANLYICRVRGSWPNPSATKEETLAGCGEEIVVEFVRTVLIKTRPCVVVMRVDATGIAIGVVPPGVNHGNPLRVFGVDAILGFVGWRGCGGPLIAMNQRTVKDDVVGSHRKAVYRQVDNLTYIVGGVFRNFYPNKAIVVGPGSKTQGWATAALHDLGRENCGIGRARIVGISGECSAIDPIIRDPRDTRRCPYAFGGKVGIAHARGLDHDPVTAIAGGRGHCEGACV